MRSWFVVRPLCRRLCTATAPTQPVAAQTSGWVQVTVQGNEDGVGIRNWVKKNWPQLPFSLLLKLLRTKQIRVTAGDGTNSRRVGADAHLLSGEIVYIPAHLISSGPAQKLPGPISQGLADAVQKMKNRILFEDEHVIALDKPNGLPSQGGSGVGGTHVVSLMQVLRPQSTMVHRLDRSTSGVLLLAKTREAAKGLHLAFQTPKAVEKTYLALVCGVPIPSTGTVRIPLRTVVVQGQEKVVGDKENAPPTQSRKRSSGKAPAEVKAIPNKPMGDWQSAVTDYEVVGHVSDAVALLKVRPYTGRKHQIRVHCATGLETPILGDVKYTPPNHPGTKNVLSYLGTEEPPNLHLHAYSIQLQHPVFRKKTLLVKAPLPSRMRKTMEAFGLTVKLE